MHRMNLKKTLQLSLILVEKWILQSQKVLVLIFLNTMVSSSSQFLLLRIIYMYNNKLHQCNQYSLSLLTRLQAKH